MTVGFPFLKTFVYLHLILLNCIVRKGIPFDRSKNSFYLIRKKSHLFIIQVIILNLSD